MNRLLGKQHMYGPENQCKIIHQVFACHVYTHCVIGPTRAQAYAHILVLCHYAYVGWIGLCITSTKLFPESIPYTCWSNSVFVVNKPDLFQYTLVMGWLRCCLGFSLVRSSVRCLRGSRSSSRSPIVPPAVAEGRLAPPLSLGL